MNTSSTGPKGRKMSGAERREARRRSAKRKQTVRKFVIPAAITVVIATAAIGLALIHGWGGSSSGMGDKPAPASQVHVSGAARTTAIPTGQPIPDFSAPGVGGGTVSWKQISGSPAVLTIWAPWCPHCQHELPILSAALASYPSVKVVSVATSIGSEPGPAPSAFLAQHRITFPAAVDDANGTLAKALGVTSFPTIYFVNKDGTVMSSNVGEVPESTLQQNLQALAAQA